LSQPRKPRPAKLIVGLLAQPGPCLGQALQDLEKLFGPIDFISESLAFDFSDYYAPEMGVKLERRWLSHLDLVDPGRLAEIKLITNGVEKKLASGEDRRTVNLDPGLLFLERLILATGKNATHRIYLAQGIWADLSLVFERGEYRPLAWTYPDYARPPLPELLGRLRRRLKDQLKELP